MSRYSGNHIRLAVVTDVDHERGVVRTQWMDQSVETGPEIPVPHPYAGKSGEGIFVGLQKGAIVALDSAAYERWFPVSVLPLRAYYDDLGGVDDIDFDDVGYPQCNDGEIIIQGKTGAQFYLASNGDVTVKNSFGEGYILGGDADSAHRCNIAVAAPTEYIVSQSGIHIHGVIRRDVRIEDSEVDFDDFLTNPDSEQVLEEVGWDPSRRVTYISRSPTGQVTGSKTEEKILRNPPFVENRQIVFEYGRQWLVGSHADEEQRFENDDFTIRNSEYRRERRSNVLSLSLDHPNELIEIVNGTLVDIFGNLLDINRNVIPIPSGSGKVFLDDTYEKVRHTVGLHMEMNSRKGWAYRHDSKGLKPSSPPKSKPDLLTSSNNTRDRSRWSVDIDKEGLTKINIPASSETGNIPRLTRYETSSAVEIDTDGTVKDKARTGNDSALLFRNEQNKDIVIDQFGPGGVKINGNNTENRLKNKNTSWLDSDGTQKTLPKFIEAGTAFHDITATARSLLEENINKNASDVFNNSISNQGPPAINPEIDPRVPTSGSEASRDPNTGLVVGQPNAGGRSLHLNLDGSLETSIGANTVDRVSWILDTAGAIVARLGRDRQGRSAIIHTDGAIAIESGGFDYVGEKGSDEVDTRFVGKGQERAVTLPGDPKRFREGKFVFRIRRANPSGTGPDKDDHVITIDDTGVTIQTAGRLNLVSDQKMTLKSKAIILLDAPKVQVYESTPKFIRRDSRTT